MKKKKITLNKDAQRAIDILTNLKKKKKIKNIELMSHLDARKQFKKIKKILSKKKINSFQWIKNYEINGLKMRHYRAESNCEKKIMPIMLFFHGGGWVIGDIETHDSACRRLVNNSSYDIISVDYRLAPEHPFPSALEDCTKALIWIKNNARHLKLDPNKIILCGDSAGGNLAAVLAILNKRVYKFNIISQILIYPVISFNENYFSKDKYDGILVSKVLIRWFENHYCSIKNKSKIKSDWMLSPIKYKNLTGLPPSLIALASCDPLYDEGLKYYKALKKSDNIVKRIVFKGQIHGLFTMDGVIEDSARLDNVIKNYLKKIIK